MLMLLAGSVTNYKVRADREYKRLDQQFFEGGEAIIKGPHLLMLKPHNPVIVIRDPRSVITSVMGSHTANRKSDYFCGLYHCAGKHSRNQGVMQLSWALMEYMTHQRKGLLVKYEHLVRTPDHIQADVGQFWGLEYDRKWSEFPEGWNDIYLQMWDHKLNGARPLDEGHDWRDHVNRVRDEFKAHPELQELLQILKYEEDASWLDEHHIERPYWYREPESEGITVKTRD